ncbi:MAG: hypothetical protein HPY57_15560 [Ignavibacteria bacterium]|nr:hypothetical protein [Ignavibacteria bacterium]
MNLNLHKYIGQYLFYKNCKVVTPACNEVKNSYKESLNHEMEISKNWNDIANASLTKKDNDTYAFAQKIICKKL